MKQKNSNLDNEIFEEEVSIDELKQTNKKEKTKIFIIFIVILIALSLFFVIFGFLKLLNGSYYNNNESKNGSAADLFVVHSKNEFGALISSFDNYNNFDNAFSYSFYIENNSKSSINYRIILVDTDFSLNKSLCNKENINFAVVKDKEVLYKGYLSDAKESELYRYNILGDSKENYEIKLWSDVGCSGYLNFKINVSD